MLLQKMVGTMPEDLPTPKKSLKQLEKEKNKSLKNITNWNSTIISRIKKVKGLIQITFHKNEKE